MLRPPYKLRLLCNEAHTSNLLPFLGRNWNLRGTKRQGLAVFTIGPPGDPRMAFGSDGPMFVGVVLFSSSPFMELCYSLAPFDDKIVLGNAFGEGGVLKEELLVPLSLFSPLPSSLLSLSLSLISSLFPSHFPSRSHSLFLSFPHFFSFSFSFPFSFALFFFSLSFSLSLS